mgnify:CR=1 FL=1
MDSANALCRLVQNARQQKASITLTSRLPFSKISLRVSTSRELQLLIHSRYSWAEKTQGRITFEADIGEPFVEVYQYYSAGQYALINVSSFEALFRRANWVDMKFPSGKKYRYFLSGSAAALSDLQRRGCL